MDSADNSAIMTIDLSRGRFRVHKSTLNKMGRPQYIQFLVNPEEMLIAILGSTAHFPEAQPTTCSSFSWQSTPLSFTAVRLCQP